MGGAVGVGDDRTFKANYSGEGAVMLRERVMEKLKEFMGDYTDDTLVEYVIVLLRNGRCKDEAKRELNVFLGDDSDSFVSWLWDHLSLNLHLYVQPNEPLPDDTAIRKVTETEQYGRIISHGGQASGALRTGSEHDGGNPFNVSRSRRKREWSGLVGELSENFPLRSTVTEALHSEQNIGKNPDVWRSANLRSQLSRKRTREDERRKTKRATDLLPKLAPSLRLLEFAVRDAVKTVQPYSSSAEPSVKRLRSVVFSSIDTTMVEKPQRPRSTSKILGPVSVALKAAAEAAEDVSKSRNAGNIFGKLGHGRASVEPIDHSSNLEGSILHDGENEEFGPITRSGQVDYKKNEYKGEFSGINTLFERDADMPADSASDNDGYDDFSFSNNHNLEATQGVYSSNKKENSVKLHYNVSKYTDAALKKKRLAQQDPSPGASTKPSSKVVNISVNVNTWKPTDYELYKNANDGEIQIGEKNEEATVKSNVNIPLLKENTASISGNDKEMALSDMQKDFRKSQASTPGISYTSSRPSDDVNSRTIFISNVHFAATKDTLSRHFNKFGEVLKVMIVTDPVNGQPIGSAYVEFLRKESAEMALSLSGTSFMSRILKVVLRNFADAPVMVWPRISRASSFASRFGRMPLPRGILPGAFHARLPIKAGARSMQWKRDSAASRTSEGGKSVRNTPSMPRNAPLHKTGRNLKYVRPDSTNIGNFGPS